MSDAPGGPDWFQAADGKWYPRTDTSKPPKKRPGCLSIIGGVVLAIILIGVIASVASGGKKSSSTGTHAASSSHPAADDVVIDSCALADNQFEGPEAKLTVTNHSSKASNYLITINFDSADGAQQIDTGNASVQALGPGQTTKISATSLKSDTRNAGKFTCKVGDVTRLAS